MALCVATLPYFLVQQPALAHLVLTLPWTELGHFSRSWVLRGGKSEWRSAAVSGTERTVLLCQGSSGEFAGHTEERACVKPLPVSLVPQLPAPAALWWAPTRSALVRVQNVPQADCPFPEI